MLAGLLVLVPAAVTLLVIRWLLGWTSGILRPAIMFVLSRLDSLPYVKNVPDTFVSITGSVLAIVALVVLIYFTGELSQYVLGKRLISTWESLLAKIPLVRSIYASTKQVMQAVSLPESAAFKSVVLVEFPYRGFKSIGFFTGYIQDTQGNRLAKVFIPTAPNPTTGFFEMIVPELVEPIDIAVEDAFKMIISAGIVSPEVLAPAPLPADSEPAEIPVKLGP